MQRAIWADYIDSDRFGNDSHIVSTYRFMNRPIWQRLPIRVVGSAPMVAYISVPAPMGRSFFTRMPVLPKPSNLDDPDVAAHAWARYWRIMRLMGLLTLLCIAVALGILFWQFGFVSIHLYIAASLGIGATMLITAALMGLVFLSSGTGHDEAIDDQLDAGWLDDE